MTGYKRVFLDTAPFIYILDGETRYTKAMECIINRLQEENAALYTSVVTIAEYLVVPYKTGNKLQAKDFFSFIEQAQIHILDINIDIAKQAAVFRSQYIGFKGMDALQLATAYYGGVDIFLTNDRRLCQCKEVHCVMVDELQQLLGGVDLL